MDRPIGDIIESHLEAVQDWACGEQWVLQPELRLRSRKRACLRLNLDGWSVLFFRAPYLRPPPANRPTCLWCLGPPTDP
jgi:hypothetical protein